SNINIINENQSHPESKKISRQVSNANYNNEEEAVGESKRISRQISNANYNNEEQPHTGSKKISRQCSNSNYDKENQINTGSKKISRQCSNSNYDKEETPLIESKKQSRQGSNINVKNPEQPYNESQKQSRQGSNINIRKEDDTKIKDIKDNLFPEQGRGNNFYQPKTISFNPYEQIKRSKNQSLSAQNIMNKKYKLSVSKSQTLMEDYDPDLIEVSMKNNPSEFPPSLGEYTPVTNTEKNEEQKLIEELNSKAPMKKTIRQIIQSKINEKRNKENERKKKSKEEHRQNMQNQKLKFLLEKISKVETYRTYFGDKYGDGDYSVFLDKLKNNQIDMETLEDELLIIADLMANQINQNTYPGPIIYDNLNNNMKTITPYSEVPYCYGNEYRTITNPRSSSSKGKIRQTNNNRNEYVEPIKLNTFLRQEDKNIKTKKRMNFGLGKK
ncbi:MAG: hypothetical protein MJ252_30550, partial [archaeon]|nr:hypothetical protein [archaeon]